MGKQGYGIDPERLGDYARQIKEVSEMGVQIGIVIGGGNIFRGLSGSQKGFDRVKGDQMGMCATVINSLALSSALGAVGVKTFVIIATLASCAESYSIQGSSSVSSLDGSKLYLKTIKDQELKNLDSCDVVHGKFRFAGLLDTVKLAYLYMDDEPLMMPVVVEKGEIEIRIDNTSRTVSGSPLNDKLYEFIHRHDQIGNEMNELGHRQSQMLLEGIDEETINRQLTIEAARLAQQEDSLVTNYIVENFDNILGPGVFMMMTSSYQ